MTRTVPCVSRRERHFVVLLPTERAGEDDRLDEEEGPETLRVGGLGHCQGSRPHGMANADSSGLGDLQGVLAEATPIDREVQIGSLPMSRMVPGDGLNAVQEGSHRVPYGPTEASRMGEIDRHAAARVPAKIGGSYRCHTWLVHPGAW